MKRVLLFCLFLLPVFGDLCFAEDPCGGNSGESGEERLDAEMQVTYGTTQTYENCYSTRLGPVVDGFCNMGEWAGWITCGDLHVLNAVSAPLAQIFKNVLFNIKINIHCRTYFAQAFKRISFWNDGADPSCEYRLVVKWRTLDPYTGVMRYRTSTHTPSRARSGSRVVFSYTVPVQIVSQGRTVRNEDHVQEAYFEKVDCDNGSNGMVVSIAGPRKTKIGCRHDFRADVEGGVSPYSYEWKWSGNNQTYWGRWLLDVPSPVDTGELRKETLIVTVTDSEGCEWSERIYVNYHQKLSLAEVANPVRKEEAQYTQIGPLVECEMTNPPMACQYSTSHAWSTERSLGVSASVTSDIGAVAAELGVQASKKIVSQLAQGQVLYMSPGTTRALGAKLVWIERSGTYEKYSCQGVSEAGTWKSRELPGSTESSAWKIGLYVPTI